MRWQESFDQLAVALLLDLRGHLTSAGDLAHERFQRLLQGPYQPGSLFKEALQFLEYWRACVGLEVSAGTFSPLQQNAACHKGSELTLQAGGARVKILRQFGELPPLLGPRESGAEDARPDFRKQSIQCLSLTHPA